MITKKSPFNGRVSCKAKPEISGPPTLDLTSLQLCVNGQGTRRGEGYTSREGKSLILTDTGMLHSSGMC